MAESKSMRIEVSLVEDETTTEATATMALGDKNLTARGSARRSPSDPNVPVVGEELATARALAELSHQLLDAAAQQIERFG